MYISEKIVYLALHKTGCSHVLKLLTSVPDLHGKIIGKHNAISDVAQESLGNFSEKLKAGNIRNPWDWYVSLWAFGSLKKGALYEQVLKNYKIKRIFKPSMYSTPFQKWKHVYSDAGNPELFREWLKLLLLRRKDIQEFRQPGVPDKIGLFTYRYLGLYTYNFKESISLMNDFDSVKKFDDKNNFIDHFIYNENLENDFRALMLKIEIDTAVIDTALKIPKTNTSLRKHYKDYYDEETIQLVNSMDKLIIEKHAYKF